jgi:hypothetical protein
LRTGTKPALAPSASALTEIKRSTGTRPNLSEDQGYQEVRIIAAYENRSGSGE